MIDSITASENQGPCQSSPVAEPLAEQPAQPYTRGANGSVAEDHPVSMPLWYSSNLQQSSSRPAASSLEAASSFLNVPPDALKLWNIAKGASSEESEDLSRCRA